jgi:PilZ domain
VRRVFVRPIPARIISPDGTRFINCEVRDISQTGAKLATIDATQVPDSFFLALSASGAAHRNCSVIWRTAKEIGVQFSKNAADKVAPGRS